jgi:hypothetical protein
MRALESLSRTSPLSPTLTSLGSSPRPSPSGRAPIPRRANKVVDDVLCVLSPLVALSQEEQLRTELLALADSAISVWHSVQTDELKIIVCACLDRANRSEWRYHKFDPLPSSSSDKDTDAEIVSSTHPRIFALFPRVIAAQKLSRATELAAGPPGSWPQSQDEPRTIETCIHTGTGLPEWSPLVIKGKYEEEERKNYIREEMERVMQEANARSRRNGGQSRRDSMVASGSGSGPPSPTTQFRGENGMMGKVEE